jgi:hypothetical protein
MSNVSSYKDIDLQYLYERCQFPMPLHRNFWLPPAPTLNLSVLDLEESEVEQSMIEKLDVMHARLRGMQLEMATDKRAAAAQREQRERREQREQRKSTLWSAQEQTDTASNTGAETSGQEGGSSHPCTSPQDNSSCSSSDSAATSEQMRQLQEMVRLQGQQLAMLTAGMQSMQQALSSQQAAPAVSHALKPESK